MNPKQPDSDMFESYLEGESSLSRAYKATAKDTPSAELDARVLERARQTVHSNTGVARSPFANNWTVPISLAAVLLLTVGLVTFMFEKTEPPLLPETAPTPSLESVLEEEAPAVREQAREADDRVRSDQVMDEKAAAKAKRSLVIESPAANTPTVQGLTKSKRQSQKKGEMKQAAPAESEIVPAQNANEPMRSRAAGDAASPIDSQQARPKKENRSLESAGELQMLDETSKADEIVTPEAWLAEIEALRAQGKHAQAEASLLKFRKRYPHYPLEQQRE